VRSATLDTPIDEGDMEARAVVGVLGHCGDKVMKVYEVGWRGWRGREWRRSRITAGP
jgi:hypothetical protein